MALTITLQTAASLAASTPAPATVTVNTGLPGPQGLPGTAATIAVGSVFAVPNGTPPTVTNVGTSSAAVFNFQLETGPQGPAGINTWGSITGTLSNQTDLQTALDGKYSTSNPAGYITSSALTPYLTISSASSTYTPKAPNDGNYYIQQSGSWVQLIVC